MLTGQMIGRGRRADAGGDGAVCTRARLQTGPKPVSRIYLGPSMYSVGYEFRHRVRKKAFGRTFVRSEAAALVGKQRPRIMLLCFRVPLITPLGKELMN